MRTRRVVQLCDVIDWHHPARTARSARHAESWIAKRFRVDNDNVPFLNVKLHRVAGSEVVECSASSWYERRMSSGESQDREKQ
jgi:hypothetical protein